MTYTTSAFNLNIIGAAVDAYISRHGGFGSPVVIASHFDRNTFEPMGYAESVLDGVAIEVERIARQMSNKRQERLDRQGRAHERYEAGEISWEEFERVYMFG